MDDALKHSRTLPSVGENVSRHELRQRLRLPRVVVFTRYLNQRIQSMGILHAVSFLVA